MNLSIVFLFRLLTHCLRGFSIWLANLKMHSESNALADVEIKCLVYWARVVTIFAEEGGEVVRLLAEDRCFAVLLFVQSRLGKDPEFAPLLTPRPLFVFEEARRALEYLIIESDHELVVMAISFSMRLFVL